MKIGNRIEFDIDTLLGDLYHNCCVCGLDINISNNLNIKFKNEILYNALQLRNSCAYRLEELNEIKKN